jgi:hypothetical protein
MTTQARLPDLTIPQTLAIARSETNFKARLIASTFIALRNSSIEFYHEEHWISTEKASPNQHIHSTTVFNKHASVTARMPDNLENERPQSANITVPDSDIKPNRVSQLPDSAEDVQQSWEDEQRQEQLATAQTLAGAFDDDATPRHMEPRSLTNTAIEKPEDREAASIAGDTMTTGRDDEVNAAEAAATLASFIDALKSYVLPGSIAGPTGRPETPESTSSSGSTAANTIVPNQGGGFDMIPDQANDACMHLVQTAMDRVVAALGESNTEGLRVVQAEKALIDHFMRRVSAGLTGGEGTEHLRAASWRTRSLKRLKRLEKLRQQKKARLSNPCRLYLLTTVAIL